MIPANRHRNQVYLSRPSHVNRHILMAASIRHAHRCQMPLGVVAQSAGQGFPPMTFWLAGSWMTTTGAQASTRPLVSGCPAQRLMPLRKSCIAEYLRPVTVCDFQIQHHIGITHAWQLIHGRDQHPCTSCLVILLHSWTQLIWNGAVPRMSGWEAFKASRH